MHRTHAFTLVELAIVLVIIGLIVGGVLVGRDLIEVATIRSTSAQIEKMQTATMAFRGKYGYLPGDIPTATRFFPAAAACPVGEDTATCNGDGDGMVEGSARTGSEWTYFWQHLSMAQLVAGTYSSNWPAGALDHRYVPDLPLRNISMMPSFMPGNTNWFATRGGGKNYFFLGRPDTVAYNIYYTAMDTFTCPQLRQLDEKLDDGKPAAGKFQVRPYACVSSTDPALAEYTNSSTINNMASLEFVGQ